jgi:predicted MFS family arabinose efflux permease
MREQLGTAVGVTIGVLLYDSLRGKLDAGSLYRAGMAFILSFALLTLLASLKKQKQD